ncbi:molybdenum cofactor guanylyltransferase [Erythrobacter ani]|uniref:Molybdenum cofactor guanylyltransferase n=1 Tax=Erythrobacter ani TaxID=2827235 RepID=A0ABS6SMS4_9SPHN|nr:molybdenum cofactor guanylyltransferase [Erythrobacter ani]MBV7265703.1 molybdenum cofactor guanylyltransferase [Erythrobacter ani]
MKILGAILAGGQARRFGSDKAHALYGSTRLIDLVATKLREQCSAVVVCGREEPGFDCLPDRPEASLGPLGGLNAALHYAHAHGFSHVLSAGVDVPNLPADLVQTLSGGGAAIVQSQPVVGLWPASIAGELDMFIAGGGRALYAFAGHISARKVAFDPPLLNVNTPDDLPD